MAEAQTAITSRSSTPAMACRMLAAGDIGRPIFASAIKPGSLSMVLHPLAGITARRIAGDAVRLLGVLALLVLPARVRPAETVRPFVLIGLGLMVIAIIDASFIGGWRPMDGGDDGLFYTGVGRQILQHLIHGDIMAALAGGESVYYYGGPGLRYLRALEMILFGDTNLGYLSLVLVLPMIVLGLYRRFLSDELRLAAGAGLRRHSGRRGLRHQLSSTTPNGRRAASPIRPRTSCCCGACS